MDGAGADGLYVTTPARRKPGCVGGRGGVRRRPVDVSLAGAAPSADLGGSSKYSSVTLED
jgi:hypothetical protein